MEKFSKKFENIIQVASGDVRRLDSVVRFSSIPIVVQELVSTHQYWVCLYSALIHHEVRPNDTHLVGQLLTSAMTHDLIEGWTGDLVRPFKYSSENLRSTIEEAEKNIFKTIPKLLRELMTPDPKISKLDHAYIKVVIKSADFLSLFQYMRREAMRGNLEIEPFYNRMINDIKNMIAIEPVSNFDAPCFYRHLYKASISVYQLCFDKAYESRTGFAFTKKKGPSVGWCKIP